MEGSSLQKREPPTQELPPAKQPRCRRSCTSCRSSNVKCSGEVPCSRCVRLGTAAQCVLYHRPSGKRVKKSTGPPPKRCPYQSHIYRKIVTRYVEKGEPLPRHITVICKLWITLALRTKSLKAMYAGTMVANDAGMDTEELFLSGSSEDGTDESMSVFDAVQDEPWPFTAHDFMDIGADVSLWVHMNMPRGRVPKEAESSVQWVNDLLKERHPHGGFEVITVLNGAMRFSTIRSLRSRVKENAVVNVLTDAEIITRSEKSTCTQERAKEENVSFEADQNISERLIMNKHKDWSRRVLNMDEVEDAFEKQVQEQMDDKTRIGYEQGIECMHVNLNVKVQDAHGRLWTYKQEKRACCAADGQFYHLVMSSHSYEPACQRSEKIVDHLAQVTEKYKQTDAAPSSDQSADDSVSFHMHANQVSNQRLMNELDTLLNDVIDISTVTSNSVYLIGSNPKEACGGTR